MLKAKISTLNKIKMPSMYILVSVAPNEQNPQFKVSKLKNFVYTRLRV